MRLVIIEYPIYIAPEIYFIDMNSKPVLNTPKNIIRVADFDDSMDSKFVKEFLTPYLKDLFRDLSLRCL